MRNEVESLQKQMSNQSVDMPLSSPNGRGDSKISSMETRLLQATNEINKLQKERRRLMDISNTLHSQLYQVHFFKIIDTLLDFIVWLFYTLLYSKGSMWLR